MANETLHFEAEDFRPLHGEEKKRALAQLLAEGATFKPIKHDIAAYDTHKIGLFARRFELHLGSGFKFHYDPKRPGIFFISRKNKVLMAMTPRLVRLFEQEGHILYEKRPTMWHNLLRMLATVPLLRRMIRLQPAPRYSVYVAPAPVVRKFFAPSLDLG